MWLFSKHGFFSAVQNYNDENLIHVRARFKGDLERLCKTYGVEPNVVETPRGDYPLRMDFKRETWAAIVQHEALEIDYAKFKPAVHDGTVRDRAYLAVFDTMWTYAEQQ